MIDLDRRQAIYSLHKEGMKIKELARRFSISPKTIRGIIELKGELPNTEKSSKIRVDPQLLARLYQECNGYVQRVHEKLFEDEGILIGYSTLTRMIRELELGASSKKRSARVPDQPGEEMQHDTSVYTVKIDYRRIRVVASLIYLRYSKLRYLRFYRSFNRFQMKSFLHEALMFWKYAAAHCIIDNTNLARLKGTGSRAIIVPEMEEFAKKYGFRFICHEIGHSNRKAGNERAFYTIETNFFPGRSFCSLEDLNQQAFEWATNRLAHRPLAKTGLIPLKAFETEIPYLTKLPPFIPPPYIVHKRRIDQYGFISFDGNYYWIPDVKSTSITLLQYADQIKVFLKRKCIISYLLPPAGVKNRKFEPPDGRKSPFQPKSRRKPTAVEEQKLRELAPEIG